MSFVLNTIEAFPRGRTVQQLFSLMDVDFNSAKRASIQSELLELQGQGLILLGRDGKWRAASRMPRRPTTPSALGAQPTQSVDDLEMMVAAPARIFHDAIDTSKEILEGTDGKAQLDPQALLRYYRAALRSDPRGAITQADDRHGTAFQLISATGDPMPSGPGEEGVLRAKLDHLPDSFREALAKREAIDKSLAFGWPISIGRNNGVPAIRPVGLVAARWEWDDDELVVRIAADDVLINPDWIKAWARASAWSQSQLSKLFATQGQVGLSRDVFLARLREVAATAVRGTLNGRSFTSRLDPTNEGIFDAVGLFLPTDTSFTSGAVRDLDSIAEWSKTKLSQVALGPLVGVAHMGSSEPSNPVNVGPLNLEQIEAVSNATHAPISVITGPPGTGKSQTIVAIAATVMLNGGTVLVASKNHQALDAVQERLTDIAPKVPFVIRTLDPAKEIDQDVAKVLEMLVRETAGTGGTEDPSLRAQLQELAQQRANSLASLALKRRLNLRLADVLERIEFRSNSQNKESVPAIPVPTPIHTFLQWLFGFFRRSQSVESAKSDTPELGASLVELEAAVTRDRATLAKLGHVDDPAQLTDEIEKLAQVVLRQHLISRCHINDGARIELADAHDDLVLNTGNKMSRDLAERVLNYRPLWLASVLGTPRRVPLYEGLFDLVIFDEASQCDIGSALPLLARAKRAVIVGDDRQLGFIPQIGLLQDRNLMAAQGLPSTGTGRFSQGRKSLFDLARSTRGVPAVMLRDQYRSAEDIVQYLNTAFYGGKLRVSADLAGLKRPKGTKAGLAWHDVSATGGATRGGNVNLAEAHAIADYVKQLLLTQNYAGSIGVIAPFREQVKELTRALQACISPENWDTAELRVATVDGFQGQERDLILFSPTVHAGSPSSGAAFLSREWRRINVAISRARAVALVFGDLAYARSGKVGQLRKLAAFATEPRQHKIEGQFDSEWERIVFHNLKASGLSPEPQYPIAGRRLDFALFGAGDIKLDLEVDGRRWHQDTDGFRKIDDHWRDHQMRALGWKVRRFWVDELKQDMESCIDIIKRDLS